MRTVAVGMLVSILAAGMEVRAQDCCVLTPEGARGVRVDVAPVPVNADEVADSLDVIRSALDLDAGVTQTAVIWLRVETDGVVVATSVATGSGSEEVDSAFLRLGRILEFRPAVLGDQPVAVWIRIPFTLQARGWRGAARLPARADPRRVQV